MIILRTFFAVLLPLLMMIIFYAIARVVLKKSSSQLQDIGNEMGYTDEQFEGIRGINQRIKENQAVAKMFLYIGVVTVVLTLLPILFSLFLSISKPEMTMQTLDDMSLASMILGNLPAISTCLSPVFYAGMKNPYNKSMRLLLRSFICK